MLRDYCDGSTFRSHSLFSADPSAIQIVLYYDDLELCNPLGSRRKIHKIGKFNSFIINIYDNYFCNIGAFYFLLGNISPKMRSKVSSIQLLALVKTSVIDSFGIDKVLEPLVKDIQSLEKVNNNIFSVHNDGNYRE